MSNLISIAFFNKRSFPPGRWLHEPDLCSWTHAQLSCLAIRDMSLGAWKGFVGIEPSHPLYFMTIEVLLQESNMLEIFTSVYGGICSAGHLPSRYEEDSKSLWWIGIETSHGGDYLPLLENDENYMDRMLSNQTYKDFSFIRKETNKLAKYISKIK